MLRSSRFPKTTQIKQIRLSLGITQSTLARSSGVSQSTIAKIERSKIKGSYSDVVRLFDALDEESNKRSSRTRLRDVATKEIISIQVNTSIKEASELLKKNDISQMPVFDGDRPVGSISERAIVKMMMDGAKPEDLGHRRVLLIMEGPFPVVDDELEVSSIGSLIHAEHAVLTTSNGKITGIVTADDLIVQDWII